MMTNHVYDTSSTTSGTNITLASGDVAYVAPGVLRASVSAMGIRAENNANDIMVMGDVYGGNKGITLGSASATGINQIKVGAGGSVTGQFAGLWAQGHYVGVTNDGTISGDDGIRFSGGRFELANSGTISAGFGLALHITASSGKIVNSGVIESGMSGAVAGSAIEVLSSGGGTTARIVNYGTITGVGWGIVGAVTAPTEIENHGTISSVHLDAGNDMIINGGLISHDLDMSYGNDTYTGVEDGIVRGQISGGLGDDTLQGGNRHDLLDGGLGNDILAGGGGRDSVNGGDGDDVITGDADGVSDQYDGGAGNDLLSYGGAADDLVVRGLRGVVHSGDTGVEDGIVRGLISGGLGDDTLQGGNRHDSLDGGAGDDVLSGGGGRDTVRGGDGSDLVRGDADGVSDQYDGGAGNDLLSYGGAADDLVVRGLRGVVHSGETGFDTISGFESVFGGRGDDWMHASGPITVLSGYQGDDTLIGGRHADTLSGGDGDDTITGGKGGDQIMGDAGNDTLTGGRGADTFFFADGFGRDVIADFAARNDAEKIDLSAVTEITGFHDLTTHHMSQHGADVWIDDGADRIVLEHVDIHDLDAADFIF